MNAQESRWESIQRIRAVAAELAAPSIARLDAEEAKRRVLVQAKANLPEREAGRDPLEGWVAPKPVAARKTKRRAAKATQAALL